jgi:hypothetical protein
VRSCSARGFITVCFTVHSAPLLTLIAATRAIIPPRLIAIPVAYQTERNGTHMSFAAFARGSSAPVVCAAILLSVSSTTGFADERCGQLVALNKQYAGVVLTGEQKTLKAQLVSWYKANCGSGNRTANR